MFFRLEQIAMLDVCLSSNIFYVGPLSGDGVRVRVMNWGMEGSGGRWQKRGLGQKKIEATMAEVEKADLDEGKSIFPVFVWKFLGTAGQPHGHFYPSLRWSIPYY